MLDFEDEMDIYYQLEKKDMTALFLVYYFPGHSSIDYWIRTLDKASAKYEKDEIVFMKIHCRKHFDFCF